LQPSRVTVVIPTLSAGQALWECVESLQRQLFRDFRIVIVDNSGSGLVDATWPRESARANVSILHPGTNIGFGAAVNLAAREARADYIAVINDDATASPVWLRELTAAMDAHPEAGSAASQVRFHGVDPETLDSAGMLIAADGTSKQRGHGAPPANFPNAEEVLLASGSASVYRSTMLAETGGFDDGFFLYHRYSHSAGRASKLKAYFVERNRLLLILKTFPALRLLTAFFATPIRYIHHLLAMRRGQGAAAQFQKDGESAWTLVTCVLRAHVSALTMLPDTLRQRRHIRRTAKLSTAEFLGALDRFAISLRQVAEL
jgi:GT2 family glycosyltransferase